MGSSRPGGDVKIEYSRDAGVSWAPVAGALEQVLGGSAVTPAAVQDWVHIGNSTTTGYVDWQADNYWDDNKVWYRVRAIDTQGNATKPSNEVYIYRPLQQ